VHPPLHKLRGEGHPKGGQRPFTAEGLPSLAALGLAGGDGTEAADPLSGRIMLVRDFGGIVFAALRAWSGDRQLAFTQNRSGDHHSP
jgi:lysyl-tRNA synthetase class 2